jgi:diguanylate cyclase (GGDEF)-like protein/PAS domain S-box-containing protein
LFTGEERMDGDKILAAGMNPENPDMPLVYRLLYQLIDEKYRPLLDESSDFMCIADREGKFIYVNKNLADSLGYTKKELLCLHMKDIIDAEGQRVFSERTREFLRIGKIKIDPMILVTKYGGRVSGEMSAMAFYDNAGKCCGIKAVFRDRTKFLEMERLEKKYESILEDGIDALDQVIMILDKDHRIRWASTSIQKYFHLDKSSVVGEDFRDLFRGKIAGLLAEPSRFLENMRAAYREDTGVSGFECVLKNGSDVCQLEHWSYPVTHGELVGGRIEIFRDITARKKSEEALEYYHKKIHAIMEHAVEGIVELRTNNTIEFVNKSFLAALGLADVEMLDRDLSDFILPEDRMRLASIKLIRRAREIVFVRKDGSLLYALVSSIPLVFGHQPPHALCFITDITEAKTVSLKLRDANLTLRAVNDSLVDLSMRDTRTGVYNARYLSERLAEEFKRARRYFRPFSLLMIDIDFFKTINDTFGHAVGDAVLRDFAELLKTSVRDTDVIVRSGGDEFVVFLMDTDTAGALHVAHKIVRAVKTTALGTAENEMHVSVSTGIAVYPDSGLVDATSLLSAADQAMYQSKSTGRNKVTVFNKPTIDATSSAAPGAGHTLGDIRLRLKNVNLRNEESVLESLRPLVRESWQSGGYEAQVTDRVIRIVEQMTQNLSLPERDAQHIRRAALLANLGYLSVPRDILLQNRPLNDQEKALVQAHPWRSAEMVRDIAFLEPAARHILCHHERFDGQGYPRGLKGEDIPLGARMIFLAESFEAMITPRPYRPQPLSTQEAREIVKQEAGRQFDPDMVDMFLKVTSV